MKRIFPILMLVFCLMLASCSETKKNEIPPDALTPATPDSSEVIEPPFADGDTSETDPIDVPAPTANFTFTEAAFVDPDGSSTYLEPVPTLPTGWASEFFKGLGTFETSDAMQGEFEGYMEMLWNSISNRDKFFDRNDVEQDDGGWTGYFYADNGQDYCWLNVDTDGYQTLNLVFIADDPVAQADEILAYMRDVMGFNVTKEDLESFANFCKDNAVNNQYFLCIEDQEAWNELNIHWMGDAWTVSASRMISDWETAPWEG